MRVSDFEFELPEDRIALEPAPRGTARLLSVTPTGVADRSISDLASLLRPGDLLVLNDTKVIRAQLAGMRPPRAEGGGSEPVPVDATLIKRLAPDAPEGARWTALVRPAKRLKAGDLIEFGGGLNASVERRDDAEATLQFNKAGVEFDGALARTGKPPLPPYIARKRALTARDAADYQTVYARADGSVAAPTAGLHFTDELLEALAARSVGRAAVTLHVGVGTFLPVTVDDTRGHVMHPEWGEVTAATAAAVNRAKAKGGRIVAVGTTSLRLLESAADAAGRIQPFLGDTSIFITPGYRFRAVDLLMTNFHLPRSTLFMLVCAFTGTQRMKAAYAHAMVSGYRFYSFGDACLLERKP